MSLTKEDTKNHHQQYNYTDYNKLKEFLENFQSN